MRSVRHEGFTAVDRHNRNKAKCGGIYPSRARSQLSSRRRYDILKREVVVAHLVERSLPTPEVRGSNPVIGKNYMYNQLY